MIRPSSSYEPPLPSPEEGVVPIRPGAGEPPSGPRPEPTPKVVPIVVDVLDLTNGQGSYLGFPVILLPETLAAVQRLVAGDIAARLREMADAITKGPDDPKPAG